MADTPWYDRQIDALYGMSAKDAAVAAAVITVPPVVGGVVLGKASKMLAGGGSAPAGKAKRAQSAPRYQDWRRSPRTMVGVLKQHIAHAKSDPIFSGQLPHLTSAMKHTKAAAKGVATKVERGHIQPFKATRNISGQFSKGGVIRSTVKAIQAANRALTPAVSAALPVAAKVAKVGGAAGLAIGAGIVGYNMLTGKHAWDRDSAMQRPNDPGRVVASGVAGSTTAAVASRAVAGVAAQTAGGMVARAAGPVGLGILAGYGAYKGYAEEGPKGAVRGAVRGIDPTALFMARPISERLTDKVLGPKSVDKIGPMLKGHFKLGKANASSPVATYTRTYTKGPKAGTTETVRRAA